MSIKDLSFFCSWSGGKDACLALYRALRAGGKPSLLLTMLAETGTETRAHGLPREVIQKQALALGIPLVTRSATWGDYEQVFLSALTQFKQEGIQAGVFGDIDLQEHRAWVEKVCASAGLRSFLPLWQATRHELLREFIEAGFQATIISVREGVLDKSLLGKTLDWQVIAELQEQGIDPSGEQGEYHTVVTAGPIFSFPIRLALKQQIPRDGHWQQEVAVAVG